MTGLLYVLTLAAVLGCGLVAGVFFAFSTFVMAALAERPAAEGIAAMQAINRTVITPLFLGALLGSALLGAGLALYALTAWEDPWAPYLLVGGTLYLIGTIAVTMRANVPRNTELAGLDPLSAEAERSWRGYVTQWTAWNHVRTAAALVAAALFAVALASG